MMTAREVSIGDNDDEKDSLTHFLSFALHRFMVLLCSGKSDDDGKDKSGKGKGGSAGGQGDDTWMMTARARVALARVTMMTRARAKVAKVSGSLDNNSN